jgi:hypothetical protein
MNELDEKTGPINEKGTAGSGVGQGRTIAQSGTAQQKGIGKESQLSKIAAAVNPGSTVEANPTATQSMISTFMKTFESAALEIQNETSDDQKQLIKTMIDEVTKLQTKNMKEFEKAIGKIVGISKDLQNSDNPILQKLGKDMEEKSREEVVKASGYTLTGEKDTFLNRLGRSVGMNTENEPVEKSRSGIGKLTKGFASNLGRDVKRGFKIAVGADPEQEGTFYNNVVRSDTEKRERLMTRIDSESNTVQSQSVSDQFKKVIEEFLKESKSESSEKTSKSSSINSEQQEDSAGISKDATIEALQKTAESNVSIQENTSETVDILKKILEKMNNMPSDGGGGGMGGGLPLLGGGLLGGGLLAGGAKALGRGVRAVGRGIASGARAIGSGARSFGRAILGGGRALARGIGSGARALATGARAITAPMAIAGTAAVAATGSILYGIDKGIKSINIGARKQQEEGTAKFGLTGNNTDGFFINGKPAGKLKDLPEYYQRVADGYGANSRGGSSERSREYVKTHNPDGSPKTEKDKKKSTAEPVAKPKPTVATTVKKSTTKSENTPKAKTEASDKPKAEIVVSGKPKPNAEIVVSGKPKAKVEASDKPKAKVEASDKPKAKATVEKSKETVKPKAAETVKEAIEPKKKTQKVDFSVDDVDKSIKGKVAEIDPAGFWAKLNDGRIVDPAFPKDADSNNSAQKAYKLGQKAGTIQGKGNQTGDQMSPKKTTGKTETGKNIDGAIIEKGTADTKEKVQVNVPPPTVINQGGKGGEAPPQITFPGGVANVRTNDSTWQRFQDKRAAG